ncbi:MAG: hypothetical protein AAFY22_13935 [Pseudomonadota bacterium]
MPNTLTKIAAAIVAAAAATTAASAQEADIQGRIDLSQEIAATTLQTENKIFELVMNKAEAKVAADIAALHHTGAATPDAVARADDAVASNILF